MVGLHAPWAAGVPDCDPAPSGAGLSLLSGHLLRWAGLPPCLCCCRFAGGARLLLLLR